MRMKEYNDLQPIKLKPIISYPREAQVGKYYLMSIDVELELLQTSWQYPEEEYAISFILDMHPFFSYEPLGDREPSIILHRFGGTYGPAEYLLTAANTDVPKGTFGITFVNGWGIPIAHVELECEIKQEVKLDPSREMTIVRKGNLLPSQAPLREEEREPILAYETETSYAGESTGHERELIETQLRQTGWEIQDYEGMDAMLSPGVAVRGFPSLLDGYLLVIRGEQVGVVKVRQLVSPLADIEEVMLPIMPMQGRQIKNLLSPRSILPFVYESTGTETRFTSYLDPEPRSRRVFTFHRPETLALWLSQEPPDVPSSNNDVLRSCLRRMPPVQGAGLRDYQVEAINKLEKSLAENRPRALILMATGSGKTQMAVSSIYRLLKYGGARRVLYLVDRSELALQASAAFEAYSALDDESKFIDLYHVQLLQENNFDPSARVCISTIQRLSSLLPLQPEIASNAEEELFFEQENLREDSEPRKVHYHPSIPIEYFDIIFVDECHRSIYGTWRPLLEYFDAFLVGLTATPESRAFTFFNRNLVYKRSLEESEPFQADLIARQLWNYCDIIRDAVSADDYSEQLTYLLFLKLAYEFTQPPYNRPLPIPREYNWDSLLYRDGSELKSYYHHILEELGKQEGMLGIIFRDAKNKIQDPAQLRHLINLINKETWAIVDADVIGEAYEKLLERSANASKAGIEQFFTPRPLIQAIVDVMRPELDQRICDPTCGTGGFLIAAHNYTVQHYQLTSEEAKDLNNHTFGWERNISAARLCAMNLFLHGIGNLVDDINCPIEIGDSLLDPPLQSFDMVLSNPPFGRRIVELYKRQPMEREDFWVETKDGDLLYIQQTYSLLKAHGRAAIVVPNGVFFKSGPGEIIRRKLLEECDLHTILRLPGNLFYNTGIPTNVIFFDRRPLSPQPWTKQIWIYDLRTNRKFNPRRNPITRADFDDFVVAYNPENRFARRESERFRAFSYEELIQREEVNLNISWFLEQEDDKQTSAKT